MHRKDNDSPRQKVGKSRLRTALRIVGILVLLIVLTLAAYGALWCVSFAHKGPADKVVCGSRLSGLAKSIRVYRNDYGWPTSNEWCDMLLKAGLAGEKQFICPASAAEIGQCTYGLNRNLIGMKACGPAV
jgi:hypothetical protein